MPHCPGVTIPQRQNAMGGHAFLDMLGAARKPMLLREAHMQRNAPRYGVDLSNLMR
jgi:hypothetical protein